jgi:predicted house-cleaning noncanonical NTP pyrophosphatase (MazG superfamily)
MFVHIADHLLTPVRSDRSIFRRSEYRPIVGTKACGLAIVPSAWTPPYLVISAASYRDWATLDAEGRNNLLTEVSSRIVSLCSEWPRAWDKGLVLRSSAIAETLSHRGAYESTEIPADFNVDAIGKAVHQIYSSFFTSAAQDAIAIVVQARVQTLLTGHLSNERRVSKTINQWMWEANPPTLWEGRFNSQRSLPPSVHDQLTYKRRSQKALAELFREVGRWCTELQLGRTHLGWGISPEALWLFQIDFEDEQLDEGVDPRVLLRATDRSPPRIPPAGSPFHVAVFSRESGWSKIDKVREFLEGRSSPYPQLCYATGDQIRTALASGHNLIADIDVIANARAVCRTDCVAPTIDRLNLPRTDSVSSERAVAFMVETLDKLESSGAKPDQVCFILHKFIPAAVAAWALARPTQQVVFVDSVWGLPDGLQYLPHDTFEYDVRRSEISSERIRYKPLFLQEVKSGEWHLIRVARTLTRHRSLSFGDLREVAIQTYQIAKRLDRPIQIMWFCDVPDDIGFGRNVPWFMMDPEQVSVRSEQPLAPGRKRITIKNNDDIAKAQTCPLDKYVLSIEPEVQMFRSPDFLEAVAQLALERQYPVALTGSILGHAFYTLERAGVVVLSDTGARTRVRQRQIFRKLVRDDIPARIAEHGERAALAQIPKTESRVALVVKLLEESQELLAAHTPKDVTAELADLTEVVRSLCAATGVDWEAVQRVAEEKRKSRGSFERNVVLLETSWPKWIDRNEARPALTISLKELAQVTSKDEAHFINFTAILAKNAPNVLVLKDGSRISISMTEGGLLISELPTPENTGVQQLELEFGKRSKAK